jgi:hypothetical protein
MHGEKRRLMADRGEAKRREDWLGFELYLELRMAAAAS